MPPCAWAFLEIFVFSQHHHSLISHHYWPCSVNEETEAMMFQAKSLKFRISRGQSQRSDSHPYMLLKTTGLQINEPLFFYPQKNCLPEPTHRVRTGHKTEHRPLSSPFLEKETFSIGTDSCSCTCFIVPKRKIYSYENEWNLKLTQI